MCIRDRRTTAARSLLTRCPPVLELRLGNLGAQGESGAKNQPEDKGVSKGESAYRSAGAGKGERKPRKRYARFGRKAAPGLNDESAAVENRDLVDKTSALLRKRKAKRKGESKDKDADNLQGPPRSQP